jgi:hypothetical protein
MDFEDIVDMDWLNSHTTDSCLPSPPLVLKQDFMEIAALSSSNADISLFNNSHDPNSTEFMDYQSSPTKDMLVMPSIEQIKQLIEIAKKQLALREQLASMPSNVKPEPTPEPESPPPLQEASSLTQLEEVFSEENKKNVIPDTVSPGSLIKTEETTIPEEIKRDLLQEESCISLEAYAETGGIDIKKLSSKERRQLRNKISARNFRVRRKGKKKKANAHYCMTHLTYILFIYKRIYNDIRRTSE